MMEILVATRNADKFLIVKRLVEALIPDARLVSLEDSGLAGDVVEVGSIQQRAVQKAEYFADKLEQAGRLDEYDAVLAVDDGLSVAGQQATPNSKEFTDRILASEWPVGTSISVVRAYALIRQGERVRVETTFVPFVFLGNAAGVQRTTGSYPLSHVLAPLDGQGPVSKLAADEEQDFNLRHSADALAILFS